MSRQPITLKKEKEFTPDDVLRLDVQQVQNGQMTAEEQQVLDFLAADLPEVTDDYVRWLPKARRTILRSLLASMLREDVADLASESYDLHVFEQFYALNVPVLDVGWQEALRRLHGYGLPPEQSYKLVTLQVGEFLLVPYARTYAFRRLDVNGDVLHVRSDVGKDGVGEVRPLLHPSELLHLVREKAHRKGEAAEGEWLRLAEELRNGSANLALAYAHHERQQVAWRERAQACGAETTVAWMLARASGEEEVDFDPSLFFEQLCVEGHNLHPGAKTKMGMAVDDVFRYAPEFGGVAVLRVVGLRREYAEFAETLGADAERYQAADSRTYAEPYNDEGRGSTADADDHIVEGINFDELDRSTLDPNRALFFEYPELEDAVCEEWAARGLRVEDFLFIPIHPWQFENTLPDLYEEELTAEIVVPVENFVLSTGATSSFRTVVPLGHGRERLALKVAVHSQMTSTVRSISANTTQNGPRFTEMIRDVLKREPVLAATFVPVCEVAGYCYRPSGDTARQKLKSRNLSALLRENVESFREPGELAIVGTALYAQSPVSGRTILAELVEQYAQTIGAASLAEAAERWVIEYAELVLPGFLTLMVKYGIGLEGHLQNSVPVFRGGRPVRMLFRDWGGARLYGPRLQAQGCTPDFYPGSVILTDNLSDMQNKVFYTVYQNHLSEIILQACRAFGVRERNLWQEVRRISDEVFGHLEQETALQEAVYADRAALYRPQIDHKALTKMRLQREEQGYCYAQVANPLHESPVMRQDRGDRERQWHISI
jgi:D-ornithine---citrate ligase